MIRSFKGKLAEKVWDGKRPKAFPAELLERADAKLAILDAAIDVNDLRIPPGNRLEQLKGDRAGQWSIRINKQWRVCFTWSAGDAFDVEIVDYH